MTLYDSPYALIGIFAVLVLILSLVLVFASRILGLNRPDNQKNSPYECGFDAFEDARMQFNIKYYLIAIIFVLFDLEIAFLFPWALIYKSIGIYGLIVMSIFLLILIAGFVYIWKQKALDWD